MRDIAAVVGVSESTVSRVLRGEGKVSAQTRAKILETADRLDFRPNALAQSLARGQSQIIGIIVEDVSEIFSSIVLRGAESVFAGSDLATLVYDAQSSPDKRGEFIRKLQARHVDGVLVISRGPADPYPSISDRFRVPVVYAFGRSTDASDLSFTPDDVAVGRLAGQHLIDSGRTRIAHITATEYGAQRRTEGLIEALTEAGLEIAGGAPMTGGWNARWGAAATAELLERGVEFDAIFCGNDVIALGAFARLHAAGRRVPEDVAIVGHDHFSRERATEESRLLTTIDPNRAEIGARAAAALVDALKGAETPTGLQTVEASLVPGMSTASDPDEFDRATYELLELLL
nr:LacI family DNA-binding transcriptional regulator [Microbacterium sp. MAH-37]